MKGLTKKQEMIFEFIVSCIRDDNYTPTYQEIADHFGFRSVNAVRDHLTALERKGYIERRQGSSRGIVVAQEFLTGDDVEEIHGLPIIGRVAAGTPITAIENLDGYLELNDLYDDTHFALHVRGDSMIDAGIWDGDFVIVREQAHVNNGEIGVAVVEGEATVKRINVNGSNAKLIAENEFYSPIEVDLSTTDFRIAGKVVGIHRVMR